jgi:hypothetical protein
VDAWVDEWEIYPGDSLVQKIFEEGLKDAVESTAGMLVLARDMRAHNLYVREATSLEPHMDRAWAYGLQRQAEFGQEGFFRLYRRYAQAARMVQLSEESIVAGCNEVLEGLH